MSVREQHRDVDPDEGDRREEGPAGQPGDQRRPEWRPAGMVDAVGHECRARQVDGKHDPRDEQQPADRVAGLAGDDQRADAGERQDHGRPQGHERADRPRIAEDEERYAGRPGSRPRRPPRRAFGRQPRRAGRSAAVGDGCIGRSCGVNVPDNVTGCGRRAVPLRDGRASPPDPPARSPRSRRGRAPDPRRYPQGARDRGARRRRGPAVRPG